MEKLSENFSKVDISKDPNYSSTTLNTKSKTNTKNEPVVVYSDSQKLVSNFYTFNFDSSQQIYLYSISTDHSIQGNAKTHYGLIKRLGKNRDAKELFKKFFSEWYVTGNSLFGISLKDQVEKFEFSVVWKKNIIIIYYEVPVPEDEVEYYKVVVTKKFKLADFNSSDITKNERENVKQFMNIVLQRMLEKLGYIRSEPGVKAVYYKKDFKNQELIQLDDKVAFVYGYKLNTNFYENNQILIKTVQKFRLIRLKTYLDYYMELAEKFKYKGSSEQNLEDYFSTFMKNRIGLAKHTERRVRVTGINFRVNLQTFTFKLKQRGSKEEKTISMFDYYKDKYNCNLTHIIQPLVEQEETRKGFNGKKIVSKIYFPLELLYILGKLDEDRFDIARAAVMRPNDKFGKTHNLMKELKTLVDEQNNLRQLPKENFIRPRGLVKNTNLNFCLKTINSNILKMPELEVGKEKIINPLIDNGNFDLKNCEPLENFELKTWIIFVYSLYEDQVNDVGRLLSQAKQALGINFKDPIIKIVDSRLRGMDLEAFFIDYFIEVKKFYTDNNDIKSMPEVAMLLIPKKCEGIYANFKNALNNNKLELTIRSQVVKYESLKKGLTVAGNILLQIWAKRDMPLWKSKKLKNFTKDTMIAGYCTGPSTKTNRSITSLCASITKDTLHFANYCKFHQPTNKLSPVISDLLLLAVNAYKKLNDKFPKKIILYRESTNEKQRDKIVQLEIEGQIMANETLKNIAITLIFVNKNCDLRFFKDDKVFSQNYSENNQTALETTSLSIKDSKNIYTNARPGTIIDTGITLNGTNEFYIISSYSPQGTSNPTHYIVHLDQGKIPKDNLYSITFDMTFLYYNVQKCIRLPAPLHNASRMLQHAAKFLTESYMGKISYNFGY